MGAHGCTEPVLVIVSGVSRRALSGLPTGAGGTDGCVALLTFQRLVRVPGGNGGCVGAGIAGRRTASRGTAGRGVAGRGVAGRGAAGRGHGRDRPAPGKTQRSGEGRPGGSRHHRDRSIQRARDGDRTTARYSRIPMPTRTGGRHYGQSREARQQTTETGTHDRRHLTCPGGRPSRYREAVPRVTILRVIIYRVTIHRIDANDSTRRCRTRGDLCDAGNDNCRTVVPVSTPPEKA